MKMPEMHRRILASAGTGKTFLLTRAYLNALLGIPLFSLFGERPDTTGKNEACDISEILTITFTDAAAGEMKSRILWLLKDLQKALSSGESEGLLSQDPLTWEIIHNLNPEIRGQLLSHIRSSRMKQDRIRISTIHSFAQSVLNKNADLLKRDQFRILTPREADELIQKIYGSYFSGNPDQEKRMLSFLDAVGEYKGRDLINTWCINAEARRVTRKFRQSLEEGDSTLLSMAFCKELLLRKHLPTMQKIGRLKEDILQMYPEEIQEKIADIYNQLDNFGTNQETRLNIDINFTRKPWNSIEKENRIPLDILREALKDLSCSIPPDDDLENRRREILDIIQFLEDFYSAYRQQLEISQKVDYDLMIDLATEANHGGRQNFRYIFLDEFQDTSPTLWEFAKNTASAKTKFFLVGDEKQAIYSFNGGDPSIILNICRELKNCETRELTNNYRSHPFIIDFYNHFFSSVFRIKRYPEYPMIASGKKKVEDETASVGFFFSFKDKENGDTATNHLKALAAWIQKLERGEMEIYAQISRSMREKESAIAILLMNSSLARPLAMYLRDLGVETRMLSSFWESGEVRDIFFFMKTIVLLARERRGGFTKEERYYITGGLKSHYLGYNDEEILRLIPALKSARWEESTAARQEILNPLFERKIPQMIFSANIVSAIQFIIDEMDILSALAAHPDYEDRAVNLEKFLEYAAEFLSSRGSSLEEFLEETEYYILHGGDSPKGSQNDKEIVSPVYIGTIHSAKGLEYPMVIIPQLEKNFSRQGKSMGLIWEKYLWQKETGNFADNSKESMQEIFSAGIPLEDKSQNPYAEITRAMVNYKKEEEYLRQLYVAITRAKNHLVFTGIIPDSLLAEYGQFPPAKHFSPVSSFLSYFIHTSDLLTVEAGADPRRRWAEKKEIRLGEKSFPAHFFHAQEYLDSGRRNTSQPRKRVTPEDYLEKWEYPKPDSGRAAGQMEKNQNLPPAMQPESSRIHGILFHDLIARYFSELAGSGLPEKFLRENKPNPGTEKILVKWKNNFINHEIYGEILRAEEKYFEFPIEISFKGGERKKMYADLIFRTADGKYCILDFKTGKVDTESDAREVTTGSGYDRQLDEYRTALGSIFPAQKFTKVIYYCAISFLEYLD